MQTQTTLHEGAERASAPQSRPDPGALEVRSYDHWHMDLAERWEVEFWTKHLGCDEQALRDALFEVGSRVGAVRAYLASRRR